MSERDRDKLERDVRVFGALLPLFFGALGGMLWWQGRPGGAIALAAVGASAGIAFWGVRALRRPMYAAWMWVFHPVGWLFSHLAMAIVYYGLVTPMALVMRGFGRDPMRRGFLRGASSYWTPRPGPPMADRYFKQY